MSDMSDNKIVKKEEVKLVKQETIGFAIQSNNISEAAVQKVSQYLPELIEKTKSFGSNNSQTTLSMMTLTMLGGHSPYRMLRQILAEVEKRKRALADAQIGHAKLLRDLKRWEGQTEPIMAARYRATCVEQEEMENKINGTFKDIAILIDAYNSIKEKQNIPDEWDEESFENEEKKHHVRRCFEMMYRNLLNTGKMAGSTLEYMQQFGIHPQICEKEVAGYIAYTEDRIAEGAIIHANDLEEFLDEMGEKYKESADKTSERLFGKKDFTNKDFMYKAVVR
tara:strand:- start:67 stop:906 length:840 start_codon:yes stop_codon:yes gene_type:complete